MSENAMPADPLTEEDTSWVFVHDMYEKARRAGFGVVPAVVLIAAWLVINREASTGDDT